VTLYAYDGASAFDLAAAKREGAILITGYIVGHPGGMEPITPARIEQIHALGMGFLPNWERGAGYLVTCSRADGVAAGREAVAALRARGVPEGGTVACPFSWDVWVNPGQYAHCGVVADGIIDGLGGHYLFTAYGQGGLIDYLADTGRLQSEGWLSASKSFPGYNAADSRVALVQRVGTPVPGTDQNIVTDPANVHAWWPAGSPYGEAMLTAADVWNFEIVDPNNPAYKTTAKSWLAETNEKVDKAIATAKAAGAAATALAATVKELQAQIAALEPGAAIGGTATVTIDLAKQ
jgi:hypothetical protein